MTQKKSNKTAKHEAQVRKVLWIAFIAAIVLPILVAVGFNIFSGPKVSGEATAREERRYFMAPLVPLTIQDEECGNVTLEFISWSAIGGTGVETGIFQFQTATEQFPMTITATTVRGQDDIVLSPLGCPPITVARFGGIENGNAIIWTTNPINQ